MRRRFSYMHLTAAGLLATVMLMVVAMTACTIQPPLRLPEEGNVDFAMGEVVTDISLVWDIDADWEKDWYYGWDDEDVNRWGAIEYPDPTNFEVRIFHYGDLYQKPWIKRVPFTTYERRFRRRFEYGYHDMLLWSNIDSPDGVQTLIIDESTPDDVHATTSGSRLAYAPPSTGRGRVFNNPDIFYAGGLEGFNISRNIEDYDYYDEEREVWVKELHTELTPLVYMYLVQVIVYNNNGRIVGLNDDAAISSMADGVSVHTGHTHATDAVVSYEMRLKNDLTARDGRPADIFGGKLTTFGLCDMDCWARSRSRYYQGSRTDLHNHLMLNLSFANATDTVYHYDVTPQMQSQVHGGIITVEIDADTVKIPSILGGNGAVFDPIIHEYNDTIDYDFKM